MLARKLRPLLVVLSVGACLFLLVQTLAFFWPGSAPVDSLDPIQTQAKTAPPKADATLKTTANRSAPEQRAPVGNAPETGEVPQPVATEAKPSHTLHVVHAYTNQPLDNVEVWLGKRLSTGGIHALPANANPFLEPIQGDPIRLGPSSTAKSILTGTSPLSIPVSINEHEFWVHAKGFEWIPVKGLPAGEVTTVALKPAGSLRFPISGIRAQITSNPTPRFLVVQLTMGGSTITETLLVRPEIILPTIPTGSIHLSVRVENDLHAGFELYEGEHIIVAGKTQVVPIHFALNPESASLALNILSPNKETPSAYLSLSNQQKVLVWSKSLSRFREDPARSPGYAVASINRFQSLQPGTYTLRIKPYSILQTVDLLPGQETKVTIDLSSLRWLRLEMVGPGGALTDANLTLAWNRLDSTTQSPHKVGESAFVRNGVLPLLITAPGTYELCSTSPQWKIKNPSFIVSPSGPEVLEVALEKPVQYTLRLLLEFPDASAAPTTLDTDSLRAEAIDHGGQFLSAQTTIMVPSRRAENRTPRHTCVALFSKPGRYQLSSSSSQFAPILVDVYEQVTDFPLAIQAPQ